MAGKQALDRKLAAVQALRGQAPSGETIEALRQALRDKSNLVVAKAAAIVGDQQIRDLIPEMTAAFARLLEGGARGDAQCFGKNALAQALKDLEHEAPELYIQGLHYRQPEPVYGGSSDTAVALRGICAHALTACVSMSARQILEHLVDLLNDPEVGARSEAARAIANLGASEGALLLRLKLGCGDARVEVLGHAMAGLLTLSGEAAIGVIARYLDHENEDLRYEAAAALGEARKPAAVQVLKERYAVTRDPRFRTALLASIGSSLLPEATEWLIGLIRAEDLSTAADAVEALAPARFREDVSSAVRQAVERTRSERLQRLLARWQ